MAGKFVPGAAFTWSRKAVDAALKLDLKESDVIIATYPKTYKNVIVVYLGSKKYNNGLSSIPIVLLPSKKSTF